MEGRWWGRPSSRPHGRGPRQARTGLIPIVGRPASSAASGAVSSIVAPSAAWSADAASAVPDTVPEVLPESEAEAPRRALVARPAPAIVGFVRGRGEDVWINPMFSGRALGRVVGRAGSRAGGRVGRAAGRSSGRAVGWSGGAAVGRSGGRAVGVGRCRALWGGVESGERAGGRSRSWAVEQLASSRPRIDHGSTPDSRSPARTETDPASLLGRP